MLFILPFFIFCDVIFIRQFLPEFFFFFFFEHQVLSHCSCLVLIKGREPEFFMSKEAKADFLKWSNTDYSMKMMKIFTMATVCFTHNAKYPFAFVLA